MKLFLFLLLVGAAVQSPAIAQDEHYMPGIQAAMQGLYNPAFNAKPSAAHCGDQSMPTVKGTAFTQQLHSIVTGSSDVAR